MNNNMQYLFDIAAIDINNKYQDDLPTLEQIDEIACKFRSALATIYPVTDEEFIQIRKKLESSILHTIGNAVTLKGKDSDHKKWYFLQDNDGFYWNRYKKYLKEIRHWGPEVVKRLHETTNNIMDDLGNPLDHERPFQRRGLLLGDVQSGKTATYTAICNKAADAGYRVIIVLAGILENLRIQTQERLDTEFVGKESKYTLDKKANQEIKNTPVGVGKIPPFEHNKQIACFTSVEKDFDKATLKILGLSLRNLNGTALFVVKKNSKVLNHLYKWLMKNNADEKNGMIDLPLLLIDDEADNASVNTKKDDATAINKAIRNILNCFRQASYLGITATPFANIFIDPDDSDDASRDLFPKDFLTALPTPEQYIGAAKIFGIGDADLWEDWYKYHSPDLRTKGLFNTAIIPIKNAEQASFFYYKHRKELAYTLTDLPESLKKAIRYFILATGISDLRYDKNEHRSMMVNVSRFTDWQNRTADLIIEYLNHLKADVENYSQLPADRAEEIKSIAALHHEWDEFGLQTVSGIEWVQFLSQYLFNAIRRIKVHTVNQESNASLNYYEYKGIGMRVIAVGGNSLSRGITIEGLCVSYFYRNTMMYDTLLQMGRWFGYRPNYEDLFKLWIGEDAIDWFGFISDAVSELRDELKSMERQNQTPKDFGLRVRQAPGALLITARNKMRTGTLVERPIKVSGRMLETPRLRADKETIESNERLCRSFIESISAETNYTDDTNTNAIIWRNIPKRLVIGLVRNFVTHPWNLNFQPAKLADCIENDDSLALWDIAIPKGNYEPSECEPDEKIEPIELKLIDSSLSVYPIGRPLVRDITTKNMLKVYGRHVRIGAGGCTKIGLTKEIIDELKSKASKTGNGKCTDSTYLNAKRNPLALIYVLKNTNNEPAEDDPDLVFALGLGFPGLRKTVTAKYVVNTKDLKNWVDITEEDDYDDD